MAYDERPEATGRNNQAWTWIIIAAVIIVVALILFFFFFRPNQEVAAPGNGVDVVEPANEVDAVDPDDDEVDGGEPAEDEDVDAVPATVEEGAWVSPGQRPFVIDGVAVSAA